MALSTLPGPLTPARRDALLAVAALALVVAPVWAPMLHLGDPTYRYESVRVTAADGTVVYADESETPQTPAPISVEIACTAEFMQSRGCFFEQYLAKGYAVPSGISSSNPDTTDIPTFERYEYVVVNGTVHETSYVVNRSRRNDEGFYGVDLALDPASADEALREVSIPAEEASEPVREAARTGASTAHGDVEVPKTPVRLDDGSYYRVYAAGRTDPLEIAQFAAGLLRLGGPLVGIGLSIRLAGRFEVRHVGDGE